MNAKDFLKTIVEDGVIGTEYVEKINGKVYENEKSFAYYANIVDEETGKPYNIPMLNQGEPNYIAKYVDYMRFKEYDPTGFNKILNWE